MRATAFVLLAAGSLFAQSWKLKYEFDHDRESLSLTDIVALAPARAIACGIHRGPGGQPTGALLLTSDGGANWTQVQFRDLPRTQFFLNDSTGWIAAQGGIWMTEEAGRAWRKVSSLKGVLRVHFFDEKRGLAVGAPKSVWSTADGGRTWTKVPEAAKPEVKAEHTVYSTIAFAANGSGMITGISMPPRKDDPLFPAWMDPEAAERYVQIPQSTIMLETADEGRRWNPKVSSLFGQITRVHVLPEGAGLTLFEFTEKFAWPSEVYRFDFKTGGFERAFREKDRAVKDVRMLTGGGALLAAIEPQGTLQELTIPGKLHILRSSNLKEWSEMKVDYRASGRRAWLASHGDTHWAALDTGIILKLE